MTNIDTASLKLIEKCVNGDEDAWRDLVNKNKGYILTVIIKTLTAYGRKDLFSVAEDYYSEVIMKMLIGNCKYLKKYNGRAELRFWLGKIAKNHTYDHLRKLSAKKRLKYREISSVEKDEEAYEDALTREFVRATGGTITALDDLENKENIERLSGSLSALSDEEQAIIKMKFVDGFSQKTIAAFIGKKQGTTASILSRALDKLKKDLEQ